MSETIQPATDRRKCTVYDWCTARHFDDWTGNEHADPVRVHTVDAIPARQGVVYLAIEETRTRDGVLFGDPVLVVSDWDADSIRGGEDALRALWSLRSGVEVVIDVLQGMRAGVPA